MDAITSGETPTLFWDADCGFCRRWIERWHHSTGNAVKYRPLQEAPSHIQQCAGDLPFQRIVLQYPDGSTVTGARAALAALSTTSLTARTTAAILRLPPLRTLSELTYSFVAAHRSLFALLTTLLYGRHSLVSTYRISGWLFPRLVGFVFLCAFVSLGSQIKGLAGSQGILPVASYLENLGRYFSEFVPPIEAWHTIPSLLWFDASDAMLFVWIGMGIAASLFLIIGRFPLVAAFLAWLCYLSFASAIPVFLNFQWDALLLETGFLLLLYIPWRRHSLNFQHTNPSQLGRLLVWWLLFRLMFESGIVKLHGFDAAGHNAWLDGTALSFHYFTQPLPTWTAYWAALLPAWFQKLSLVITFIIELIFPFFIFAPRRLRLAAFWAISLLMLLIMATGNFGFFNILTIALAVSLVDDVSWPLWLQSRFNPTCPAQPASAQRRILPCAAIIILAATIPSLLATMRIPLAPAFHSISSFLAPFRSTNSYGLFSVMTTERPEISIEASADGIHWAPYNFKWKMDAKRTSMPFITPHMPRLDWQMWFAALEYRASGHPPDWLFQLLLRLEQRSPDVLLLFEATPDFTPTRFRLHLDLLSFLPSSTHFKTGLYWTSSPLPEFILEGSLKND